MGRTRYDCSSPLAVFTIKCSIMNKLKILTGALSFLGGLLICVTLIDTIYQPPPYTELDSVATVSRTNGLQVLTVDRRFQKNNKYQGAVTNMLVSMDGSKAIPLAEVNFSVYQQLNKTFILPQETVGEWCIQGDMKYSYRLSLREHGMSLKPLCVVIKK